MTRPGPGFDKKKKADAKVSPVNSVALDRSRHTHSTAEASSLGSVAVIGAGVSGLAAAYRLRKEGVAVTIFDSGDSPGGKIRSRKSVEGFIWDEGANTMMENNPTVTRIIQDLKLEEKQIFPVQQKKRYVVRGGKPLQLPSGPLDVLSTPILSLPAKLRLLSEPFLWKKRPADLAEDEESVASFLQRHIGQEPVDYLVDPFCAGTFGSDPSSLSMRHAFPEVWELEKKYGSLLVGALKSQIEKAKLRKEEQKSTSSSTNNTSVKSRQGSFSFLRGTQTLPLALAKEVGEDNIHFLSTVLRLTSSQQKNISRPCWTVTTKEGDSKQGRFHVGGLKGKEGKRFDAVIITAPMANAREISVETDGKERVGGLGLLPPFYRPMALVVNAFREEDVKQPLPGFGVLIPTKETGTKDGFKTLGTLFSSSMFPDRAPSNFVLFTTFIGGSRRPTVFNDPQEELQAAALDDLKRLLRVEGNPVFSRQVKWKEAFPEYGKNYSQVLASITRMEKDLPGLFYAGNHSEGLAVGKALTSGWSTAGRVIEFLNAVGGSQIFTMA